ncbi:6-phosphogluconolactonase [subsurface metagenome]
MDQEIYVYIGTYTCPIEFGTGQILQGRGEGIYVLKFNLNTVNLKYMYTIQDVVNPSYIALKNNKNYLYSVNEIKNFNHKISGSVSSFVLCDNKFTFKNKQPTNGADPCYVSLNQKEQQLYVTNFMTGNISIYNVGCNGEIGELIQMINHSGSSIDSKRQSGPHAHCIIFSPDGQYALVADLGLDKLMIYKVDGNTGKLDTESQFFLETKPGSGPRHCIFGKSEKYCYLINELDCTINVIHCSFKENKLEIIQSVSSLPEGIDVKDNSCADIQITPDGNFLYGSNRGRDSLITYSIDKNTGLLSYAGYKSSGGKTPRNFAIDPTGNYLLCANQDSDTIVVFTIDTTTGNLSEKSQIDIPSPVCIKFKS